MGFPKEKRLPKQPKQPILNSNNPNQKRPLICGTWNIKRGLINKELEIKLILEKDEIDIDVALSRDPRSEIRVKMHPVELGGDGKPLYIPESEVLPAKTLVRVVERLKNYTIVQCKPHTGRQHQIRVHVDHIGHPIIGDKLYGNTSELFLKNIINTVAVEVEPGLSLFRHALHAYRLSFFHPVTREKLEFRCDLPPALQEFLNAVKSQS